MLHRPIPTGWVALAMALSQAVGTQRAAAHGLDAHIASVRISGDTVYIDATPSTRAFAKLDDDGNGLMHRDEVKRHREELLSFFDSAFRVFDDDGQRGRRIFADVSTPHAHDGSMPGGAEHLRFTFRYQFAAEPRRLRVQWFEAARDPLEVHAVRSLASKLLHEQKPLGAEEIVTLTELQPAAFLLAVPPELDAKERDRAPATADGAPATSDTGPVLRHAHILVLILLIGGAVGGALFGWRKRRS